MPSKAQNQAITHWKGPAFVCAGPGSGKTFTIIKRVLHLICYHHIDPTKILVITYTKAAAEEMKARFEAACALRGVHFGTFHSICFQILRQCKTASATSLIHEGDKRKLLEIILHNQGFSEQSGYDLITGLQNLISRMKNRQMSKDDSWLEEGSAQLGFSAAEVIRIRNAYDRQLKEQGMLDFDDMILRCLQMLEENPVLCSRYQQMFAYILTDEFQDVNQPQYQLLKLLSLPEQNLFVVGDDDQAIYGFRGASPGIMKQFAADFPDAKQVMLTENYRSGGEIVAFAEKVISRNKERFPKKFYPVSGGGEITFACFETRKEEEMALLKSLSALKKEAREHTAILLRTNREAASYSELLREAGIEIKESVVSGEDIFHSFLMEDVAAFLSYLYCGEKRGDLLRFMNKPNRFFTREALLHERALQQQMEQYYQKNPVMCLEVKQFFAKLKIAQRLSPSLAVSFFRKSLGYDHYLQQMAKNAKEAQSFQKNAQFLQQCFAAYKVGSSLSAFIRQKAEEQQAAAAGRMMRPGVSILTMHGAKGLEFERVYLPDMNEGVIPGREIQTPKANEEERRLLYVAITRAKKELHILYTRERNRKPSRYLEGLIPPP